MGDGEMRPWEIERNDDQRKEKAERNDTLSEQVTKFGYPEPSRRKTLVSSSSANNFSQDSTEALKEFVEFEKSSKAEYRSAKIKCFEELKIKHLQALEIDTKRKDLEEFLKPHDHLTGYALELVIAQKREIADRWGWTFY